ncbi:LolA family protein [Amycolatopsis taiwanensis]|uniref:Membrane protein n=1 Tax=Amycolatopsis taiwanensis TaxID=342230 RepID=A0A9W6QYS9_9PSEU|nr:sigma-E factor regulatory protein RseB domain-containing protein [Amycolatopsis taiwanensis]GLY64450.1 membrane protein [Amycolatopsis taiwanensis]
MQAKTKAITAAVTGCALGVGGLAWLAMPASAGEAPPSLPPVSAEELVQSVLSTTTPALDGTVQVTNNLGLPTSTLPGGTSLNIDSAHVYNDGNGNSKLSVQQGDADTTVVHNGTTVWTYQSKDNKATKVTVPADKWDSKAETSDPAAMASQLVAKIRETSTVNIEGTARVAGRAAYEVVLTPKPTERTLLREIRIDVDAEKRVPLRLAVMSNGTDKPALQVGFTDVQFRAQPASEFQFTPPQGAKVTEEQANMPEPNRAEGMTKLVGDGWDTVLTGSMPATALQPQQQGKGKYGQQADPQQLLQRFAKPVSGPFGTGYVFSTTAGTALLTDDGRFAIGAVPEQVLIEALGSK